MIRCIRLLIIDELALLLSSDLLLFISLFTLVCALTSSALMVFRMVVWVMADVLSVVCLVRRCLISRFSNWLALVPDVVLVMGVVCRTIVVLLRRLVSRLILLVMRRGQASIVWHTLVSGLAVMRMSGLSLLRSNGWIVVRIVWVHECRRIP